MIEQILLVLVSASAIPLVWLPYSRVKNFSSVAGIIISLVAWLWLPFTNQPRIPGILGAVLTGVGIILFLAGTALSTMASRTIMRVVGWGGHSDPSRLVSEGAYGFVRHPVYSGLTIGTLGWTLIWGGVYAIILTPVAYLLFRLEAWMEEKLVLKRKFSEEYEAYRKKVPAFFGNALVVPLLTLALLIGLGILLGWVPLSA